jgi:glycosyltransferase involved in cell wall biosynthesis
MPARVAMIHGNDGSDVRVGKTCRSLARLGFDAYFVGWDRRPDAPKTIDLGGCQPHVIKAATVNGKGTAGAHAKFIRHAVTTLAKVRPDVVCAVNEELACAVLPFKGILYRKLVCDIFDSLSARAGRQPAPLRAILNLGGGLGLRGADRLIATDEERRRMLGKFAGKTVVIENVPEDPGEQLSLGLPEGPTRIWVGGSLDEGRGLRQLMEAIEPLPDVEVVSAGWPYDPYSASVFVKHPRVRFNGIVTAGGALQLAASCDAVFSYYAPRNSYMINASPNKVYDALAVGRPVLINSEVKLAGWVESERVGYVRPYEDVDGLRETIASLSQQRGHLSGFARRVRSLFLGRYQWAQMEPRLAALYEELARGTPG